MKENLSPLVICAAPTAGKAVLMSLLEGGRDVFCTPLWHDNVAVACSNINYNVDLSSINLHNGIYGGDLRYKILRETLINTEWSRLELISHLGFYIFHLSSSELLHIKYNLNFNYIDEILSKMIYELDEISPCTFFNSIFGSLIKGLSKTTNNYRYAATMPYNEFFDYHSLLKIYPTSKIIYIKRELYNAIGSTILRTSRLENASISSTCRMELSSSTHFYAELSGRNNRIYELQKKYPDRVFVVDFDKIIMDTRNVMKEICNFLDIEFLECMTKATFQGSIISDKAVGCVQDNIQSKVTSKEREILHDFISVVRGIGESKISKYITIPSNFFFTAHGYDDEGRIYPTCDQKTLFYGPYISLPAGKFVIEYVFDRAQCYHSIMSFDCVDDNGKIYFHKTTTNNNPKFILNHCDVCRRFEFRCYLISRCKNIKFCGINIYNIDYYESKYKKSSKIISVLESVLGYISLRMKYVIKLICKQ